MNNQMSSAMEGNNAIPPEVLAMLKEKLMGASEQGGNMVTCPHCGQKFDPSQEQAPEQPSAQPSFQSR